MAEELLFKVEKLFCKQDVEKLSKVVCSNTPIRWRANYSIGKQKGPELHHHKGIGRKAR